MRNFWLHGTQTLRVKEMLDELKEQEYKEERMEINELKLFVVNLKEAYEEIIEVGNQKIKLDRDTAKMKLKEILVKYDDRKEFLEIGFVNKMIKKFEQKNTKERMNEFLAKAREILDDFYQRKVDSFGKRRITRGESEETVEWQAIVARVNQFNEEVKTMERHLKRNRSEFMKDYHEEVDVRIDTALNVLNSHPDTRPKILSDHEGRLKQFNDRLRRSNNDIREIENKLTGFKNEINRALENAKQVQDTWKEKIKQFQREQENLLKEM